MSELVVKPSVMNRCVSSEQGIAKKLNNLSGEITSIQRSLSFNIRSRAKIDSQLTALAKVSQKNSQNSGQLAKVLSEAVGIYNSAENTVQGNIKTSTTKKGNNSSGKGSKTNTQNKNKEIDWKDVFKRLFKVVGKTGTPGSIIKAISGFFLGDGSFKDYGKATIDLIGSIGKACKSTIVSAASKWGSRFLTFIDQGVENAEEFNYDFSNPRMYGETAIETIVKVGGGAAVAAAIGAPGWAGILIYEAVDFGLDYFTGQGIDEYASDFVMNVTEYIGEHGDEIIEGAGKVIDGAGKAIGEIGKAVGDGAKQAGEAIAKWFNW